MHRQALHGAFALHPPSKEPRFHPGPGRTPPARPGARPISRRWHCRADHVWTALPTATDAGRDVLPVLPARRCAELVDSFRPLASEDAGMTEARLAGHRLPDPRPRPDLPPCPAAPARPAPAPAPPSVSSAASGKDRRPRSGWSPPPPNTSSTPAPSACPNPPDTPCAAAKDPSRHARIRPLSDFMPNLPPRARPQTRRPPCPLHLSSNILGGSCPEGNGGQTAPLRRRGPARRQPGQRPPPARAAARALRRRGTSAGSPSAHAAGSPPRRRSPNWGRP